MRTLLRSHLRFFLLAALSGLALRLLFLFAFPAITADSFIYGDIAKNWFAWGWRFRLQGKGSQGRIYRLLEPAFLTEAVIVLCASLFKRYR